VRLDSTFPTHDKVLELVGRGAAGYRAGFVYACSLAHCGAHSTDGLITFAALPFIHGRKADAQLLVETYLWRPVPIGWQIPHWAERQQSSADTAEIRRKQSAGARKANCVRWHGADCGCWSGGRDSPP
jgi:hypothetical protein